MTKRGPEATNCRLQVIATSQKGFSASFANTVAGTVKAALKKAGADECSEDNAAACYDHTGNLGIGPVKVSRTTCCRRLPSALCHLFRRIAH